LGARDALLGNEGRWVDDVSLQSAFAEIILCPAPNLKEFSEWQILHSWLHFRYPWCMCIWPLPMPFQGWE